MPNIKVRNATAYPVKAGFYILGMLHPTRWNNALAPGTTWDAGDFPSWMPQSFEVRRGPGHQEEGAGFKEGDTMLHVAQMAMAGTTGAAAISTGTLGVLNGQTNNVAVAGVLWNAANAGGAAYGKEVPDSVKRVGISVWFSPMELVICGDGSTDVEVWCDGKQL